MCLEAISRGANQKVSVPRISKWPPCEKGPLNPWKEEGRSNFSQNPPIRRYFLKKSAELLKKVISAFSNLTDVKEIPVMKLGYCSSALRAQCKSRSRS